MRTLILGIYKERIWRGAAALVFPPQLKGKKDDSNVFTKRQVVRDFV